MICFMQYHCSIFKDYFQNFNEVYLTLNFYFFDAYISLPVILGSPCP